MRIWSLASGSRGNAVLVECGDMRVLVDVGLKPRELARRLATIDVPPESIEAVLITHEHGDHACGAAAGARRWGWTVYATEGTARCPELAGIRVERLPSEGRIALRCVEVQTVPVSHDAHDPVALVLTAAATGARVGVVTDAGTATPTLRHAMQSLDVLIVEANHDPDMLRSGPYPPVVQQRIAGRRGHLSNEAAALLAREAVHAGLGDVVLAHLSEQCNDPLRARETVGDALRPARFRGRLWTAAQERVVGPIEPRVRAAVQLGLGV